tara:strand:+ start:1299 stop:1505 length:207 start_codon:yes stop_codon:yes gene_type:complete
MLKRGKLEKIENLDAKKGSSGVYFRVLVWKGDGYQNLLLTKNQLEVAIDRATKNPEDEIQPGWLDKLI